MVQVENDCLEHFHIMAIFLRFLHLQTSLFSILLLPNLRDYSWETYFFHFLCYKLDSCMKCRFLHHPSPAHLFKLAQRCSLGSVDCLPSHKQTSFFPTLVLLPVLLWILKSSFLSTLHVTETFLFSTVQLQCHIPSEAVT